ncbi:hypothetical protein L7F22_008370 [Adiantum nelumboides]|nr:hypothetical protein [Adiantum nelumboides]
MGKESLHRRSFHSDNDLKSMENMLELEKALLRKRANVDKPRVPVNSGGFEAPRNSLDVSAAGVMEMRRYSEVKREDIPIGYELSRSLTARRRNGEILARKSMSSVEAILSKPKLFDKENVHTDQMSRAPNVVARLMGLDPLPRQRDGLQCSSELFLKKVHPQQLVMSESHEPSIMKQCSMSHVVLHKGSTSREENLSDLQPANLRRSKAIPSQDHPQEKQLQVFNKELGGKLPMPSKLDMGMEKGLQQEKVGFKTESLQESQEFLDALDFLHSNKEFFVKVLKDPSSLFAKHGQERGRGASKAGLGQLKGSKPTRSFSKSKTRDSKQVSDSGASSFSPMRGSYISVPLTHKATQSDKMRVINRSEPLDKEPSIACTSLFGQDEHMPQRRSLQLSPVKSGNDQRMPTKIVVLRPKLGRHAKTMPSVPYNPDGMFDATNMFTPRETTAKTDGKERLRCEPTTAARNYPKDLLKDDGEKASHSIKQAVEQHMGKSVLSEKESTSLAKSSSRGNQVPPQRGGAYGDTTSASDGEGYCSSSRWMTRDNVRANVSLPSSPRFSRNEPEAHSKYFGDKGTKGVHGEKLGRVPASSSACRDAGRDYVGVGRAGAALDAKQGSVRNSNAKFSTRRGTNKGSLNDTRRPSKSLQKSPSAPLVETRNSESKQNGSMDVISLTLASSNTSKVSERSPLKEKLMSLKDSLLSSKKKSSKKSSSILHGEHSIQSTDVSHLGDLHSTMSTVYPWRAPTLSQGQTTKPATGGCQLDDHGGSANSKAFDVVHQMQAFDVVHQWPIVGDLLESASDASTEKCEQPSPVSVLGATFDEASPSPELSVSACHEASLLRFSPFELDYKKRLLDLQGALVSSSTTSQQNPFKSVSKDTMCDDKDSMETLSVCGIASTCGTDDELIYIRDLLAFAGFTNYYEDGKAQAFNTKNGFKPSLFEKMENYYASINGTICHTPLNSCSRRMIFDVVDEILVRKLGEPPWQLGPIKQEKLGFYVAHTCKEILEQIWVQVCDHRYVPSEYSEVDSLDALVLKDLVKNDSWMHSQADLEAVAQDLEKLVCGDLIREMTHELKLMLRI